jgi:hypothetical protein
MADSGSRNGLLERFKFGNRMEEKKGKYFFLGLCNWGYQNDMH